MISIRMLLALPAVAVTQASCAPSLLSSSLSHEPACTKTAPTLCGSLGSVVVSGGGMPIKYLNVTTKDGQPVHLVITSTDHTYELVNPSKNGCHGEFGQINIRPRNITTVADPFVFELKFEFQDDASNPVVLENFPFSWFDMDSGQGGGSTPVQETIILPKNNTCFRYVLDNDTDIEVNDNVSDLQFSSGGPPGFEWDNPANPNDALNLLQRKRTVTLLYTSASSFVVKVGTKGGYAVQGGRNLLFGFWSSMLQPCPKTYRVVGARDMNYTQAIDTCSQAGGALVQPRNAAQFQAVVDAYAQWGSSEMTMWFGLTVPSFQGWNSSHWEYYDDSAVHDPNDFFAAQHNYYFQQVCVVGQPCCAQMTTGWVHSSLCNGGTNWMWGTVTMCEF